MNAVAYTTADPLYTRLQIRGSMQIDVAWATSLHETCQPKPASFHGKLTNAFPANGVKSTSRKPNTYFYRSFISVIT